MTTGHCPSCGASVACEAPWCTLCFTDLRPRSVSPTPEPTVSVPAVPAPPVPVPPAPVELAPDPILDGPLMTLTQERPAVATWPCTGCGARVSLDEDACPDCRRPFLASDPTPSLRLPGVGNVAAMDTTNKVVFCVVGGLGLTLLLVVLGFVAGSVF